MWLTRATRSMNCVSTLSAVCLATGMAAVSSQLVAIS